MPLASPTGSPNTRAVPLSGLRKFIKVLMVVVLPAPFRPKKPKMLPAGTLKSSPSSARCPLNDFRRSFISMTQSLMFSFFLPGAHRSEFVLQYPAHLLFSETESGQPFDRRLGNRLSFPHDFLTPHHRLADERSRSMPQFNDTFVFQLAVSPDHRVRIHHQVFGQFSHRRKLIPGM